MKHTQGKWKSDSTTFSAKCHKTFVNDEEHETIAVCYGDTWEEAQANAKLIVKACNSHAELLEALQKILEGKGAYDMDRLKHASNCIEEMKEIANQAISKAEGI